MRVQRADFSRSTHSRRALLHGALIAAGAAASGALLAACGDDGAPTAPATATLRPPPATGTTAPPVTAPPVVAATAMPMLMANVAPTGGAPTGAAAAPRPAATDGKLPAPAPGVPDAYLTPPMPSRSVAAVPGRGGKATIFLISGLPPVPGRENNAYWRELERRVGATLDYTIASSSAYQEKLAALTAGGSLADLTAVLFGNAPEQARVVQQGAYADLTPFLTGDALKEHPNLAAFPPQIWKNVAIRGKIYGVPRPRFLTTNSMSFRQDWADKAGIPNPKNADDFLNLLVAVTRNDPDANGKADTFGLGTYSQNPFCLQFLQYMFRVPNEWRKNADGSLTYFVETEEFKQALAYARRLYEAGIYHPDTASLTTEQARTLFNGSKIAGFNDFVSGLAAQRRGVVQLTPTAKVVGLVPFGHDGGKAVTYNDSGYLGFLAIPARVGRDRERVRELLRILDYFAAPFGSEEYVFLQNGIEGVHHTLKPDGTRMLTDVGKAEIGALPALMNGPQTFYFPEDPGLAPYMQRYVGDLLALGIDNPVLTEFSPTEATKANELSRLRIDRAIAIITGREPLSALDTWIRDWRSRGGDQIRKEYEDALRA